MRHAKRLLGVGALATLLVSLAQAPVSAQVARPSPNPKAHTPAAPSKIVSDLRMIRQGKAQRVADAIDNAVRRYGLDGFTGQAVAPGKVTVYWKGGLPAAVKKITDNAPVEVKVHATRFSLNQLEAAAKQVIAHPPAGVTAKVSSAGPSADFSAVQVTTTQAVDTGSAPKSATNGIPLRFTVEPMAKPVISRWDDSSPFWGGAMIVHRGTTEDNFCTTGFGLHTVSGSQAMLTAQHCGTREGWRTPDGDRNVGTSNAGNASSDSMLLTGGEQPCDGCSPYGASIYVADWHADSSNNRPVADSANPALNSYVFASGAASGASVLRVSQVGQFITGETGKPVGPGFRTVNEEGDASVGSGDSGGPVASTFGDDFTRVTARGMIDAVFPPFGTCMGWQESSRKCSTQAFHVNITTALAPFGAQVNTQ